MCFDAHLCATSGVVAQILPFVSDNAACRAQVSVKLLTDYTSCMTERDFQSPFNSVPVLRGTRFLKIGEGAMCFDAHLCATSGVVAQILYFVSDNAACCAQVSVKLLTDYTSCMTDSLAKRLHLELTNG